MPELDPLQQRRFATDVVDQLRASGHTAYWAGGCVRDRLLGLVPKDYDVATSAKPDQIRAIFGHRRTLAIGAAFGVITVLGGRRAGQIEVATFREDAQYSDGRHPDNVRFSTAEMDAQRRDFTINGLFFDPHEERVIDYVGGQQDLGRRLIRAIGNPQDRIAEDRLRMLRAVRFAATFGFQLEAATLDAIRAMAHGVVKVSAERIAAELRRMLEDSTRRAACELLVETELLSLVLPEVADLESGPGPGASDWQETLRVLDALVEPKFPLSLAALLHRCATPDTINELGQRLRLSNHEVDRATWLLQHHALIVGAPDMKWSQLQPLLVCDGIDDLLAMRAAIASPDSPDVVLFRQHLRRPLSELDPPLLLTGDDLIAHGIQPGPAFRGLLDRIRAAQLDEEISSREEGLTLVDRLLAES